MKKNIKNHSQFLMSESVPTSFMKEFTYKQILAGLGSWFVGLFLTALVHEMSHILVAAYYGVTLVFLSPISFIISGATPFADNILVAGNLGVLVVGTVILIVNRSTIRNSTFYIIGGSMLCITLILIAGGYWL
jgi:hypothetical protein